MWGRATVRPGMGRRGSAQGERHAELHVPVLHPAVHHGRRRHQVVGAEVVVAEEGQGERERRRATRRHRRRCIRCPCPTRAAPRPRPTGTKSSPAQAKPPPACTHTCQTCQEKTTEVLPSVFVSVVAVGRPVLSAGPAGPGAPRRHTLACTPTPSPWPSRFPRLRCPVKLSRSSGLAHVAHRSLRRPKPNPRVRKTGSAVGAPGASARAAGRSGSGAATWATRARGDAAKAAAASRHKRRRGSWGRPGGGARPILQEKVGPGLPQDRAAERRS